MTSLILKKVENYAENVSPKPFIKWVGGKRQLLPEIQRLLPKAMNNYFEPFIGGGAVLFSLGHDQFNKAYINDYNEELINVYEVVKNSPGPLLHDLKKHKNNPDYFYKIRVADRNQDFKKWDSVKRASRFIYLNKTGYNGLYRVNSKGQNNVPFGKYKNPNILDEDNIFACSNFLENVQISYGDFEDNTKKLLGKGDFVYFDPPYAPLSATSNFTSYTDVGFDVQEQIRLKEFCDFIHKKGAKFMLSNSAASLIKELYSKYNITTVMANRAVNCKAQGRGKIEELIITNYHD